MADPTPFSSSSTYAKSIGRKSLLIFLLPVVVALLVYRFDSFDPAHYPAHELSDEKPITVTERNSHMLEGAEKIGVGQLLAPEDIAYEPKSGVIYTGCVDGWVKRVTVNESAADSVVENWINTGGRPLGIAHGHHGEVIIADAVKGLLNASGNGAIQVLTEEADGLKFKLTDAVDIGEDGTIYFTDASYKYSIEEYALDFYEGRPYGRLMSYNPFSKHTNVLLRDLYFANGVAVSADQHFLIFCETPMRRCKKYYVRGERKGSVDIFVENLPGMPDNIRYDGDAHYWIAISSEYSNLLQVVQKYPLIRKILGIMEKYIGRPIAGKNGGVIAVDLEGKPTLHFSDHDVSLTSSSIKIGDYLYFGSIVSPYILRLKMIQNPAVATAA